MRVSDEFDVAVHDAVALDEIELLTNLIIATSDHPGRLTQDEIDVILGVSHRHPSDAPAGEPVTDSPAGSAPSATDGR